MDNKNNRRSFLKKSLWAGLGTTFLPLSANASNDVCEAPLSPSLTTQDAYGQGPFYLANAPFLTNRSLAEASLPHKIRISGYVTDTETLLPIENVEIDIWHANPDGQYDANGYTLRGKVLSDENGFYSFDTIKPGHYPNGGSYRPSHIHFKITAPGESPLITQLYFENDPYLASDFASSKTSGTFDATERIISLSLNEHGISEGCWNINLDLNETVNAIQNNLNSGIIYSTSTITNNQDLTLEVGIFENSETVFTLYDLKGNPIGSPYASSLSTGKHSITIPLPQHLSKGTYLIQLMVNNNKILPKKFIIL